MRGEADRTLPGEGLLYQEQRQEVQTTFTDGVSFHPGYLEGMEWLEVGSSLEHLSGKQNSST